MLKTMPGGSMTAGRAIRNYYRDYGLAGSMTTRRVLILGDSHICAIVNAYRHYTPKSRALQFELYRFSKLKNDVMVGDVSLEDSVPIIAGLGPGDMLVLVIGGNQHSFFGLMQHDVPFTMFDQAEENRTVPGNVQTIPYYIIRDILEIKMRNKDEGRLEQICKHAHCRVFHLAPPPPKQDEAHILRHHEKNFRTRGLKESGITPAPLRLKLWNLQNHILRDICRKRKIEYVPVPAEAICPRGYLKPEYYADDATHANMAYGELVLQQLESIARSVSKLKEEFV